MAKVGVRIEGEETLSKAAGSAAKGLKQLKAETADLKKSVQDLLQPMINIRSTIFAVMGGAGVIQLFRGAVSAARDCVSAFAKTDEAFGATVSSMRAAAGEFKAGIGGLIAELAGPFMQTLTTIYQAMNERLAQARLLRQALREVGLGILVTDAQKVEDELSAVLKRMIEIIKLQEKGWIRPQMTGVYEQELRQLDEVRRKLLAEKQTLQEIKEIRESIARMQATGAEAAAIVGGQEAALEAVRALIRGETALGKILDLQDKIASLEASGFANEQAYEEARLETLKKLKAELADMLSSATEALDLSEMDAWLEDWIDSIEVSLRQTPPWMLDWEQSIDDLRYQKSLEEHMAVPFTGSTGNAWAMGPSDLRSATGDAMSGGGFSLGAHMTMGMAPSSESDLAGALKIENLGAFGDALQGATTGAMGFAGGVLQSVMAMGPLGLLFEALKPVLAGIMSVLGPALNQVLAPLLGAFVLIGETLGRALLPILQALTPVFEILGMVVAMLVPVIDALSRPVEFVADLLGWLAEWLKYGVEALRVFFHNLFHPFDRIESTVEKPGGFSSDAFTRAIATADWQDLTAAGAGYLDQAGGGYGGGTGGGATIQQVPDINVYLTINGPVVGAGGLREVGEYVVSAVGEYLGTGARVSWLEA